MSDMYGYAIETLSFSSETWQLEQKHDGNGCYLPLAAASSQVGPG